jgi:ketosteroid isomerase-like protein
MTTELTGTAAEYVKAVNSHDTDAIVALFTPDAYVNDARHEIHGTDSIRRWIAKEITGDNITMEVREVFQHYDETIVRSRYDGTFDRTNLPDEIILTDYIRVRDGKIVSLVVIRNQPSPY